MAVVTEGPVKITSPEPGYKFLTHSILPGVILRLLYDKRKNLIKLGRKIKSLSGSRKEKNKKQKNRIEVTREEKT